MDPQTLASFTTQLKGAPFSILFVMVELDRSTGPDELTHFTGYSAHTVQNGLSRLAFMGLAQREGRYHGWTVTPDGRGLFRRPDAPVREEPETRPAAQTQPAASVQPAAPNQPAAPVQPAAPERDGESLPVPAPDGGAPPAEDARPPGDGAGEGEFLPLEGQKITVAPCCSSYTHGSSLSSLSRQDTKLKHHELQTTPCQTDPQNLPVTPPRNPGGDPQAEAAVAALRASGCPERTRKGKGARDAVAQAMALGWSGAEVLAAVEAWFAYAESPAGRTIKHKGFFTMSRLRIGETAPPRSTWGTGRSAAEDSAAARDALARSYIEAQYQRIVRH